MTRKEENAEMIKNLSTTFTGTKDEGIMFLLGNISAILFDISKSLAILADEKEEKKCENCANCSPWDGYCGLGNNEEARDRGVCERWEK